MNPRSRLLSRREMLRLSGLLGAASLVAPALVSAAADTPVAPAPTPLPTLGHYRFKIGALDAVALIDGGMAAPLADTPFAVGEPRSKLTEVLHDGLLPEDVVRVPFNVLLVRLAGEWVMVDAGCGSVFGPAGGRLVSHLAAAGIAPRDIGAIVISHLHGDHFGGLLDANDQPVFPQAKLFLHRNEHAFWSQPAPKGVNAEALQGVQHYLKAFAGKWQLISGGEKLIDGLEVIDAPGHTPGHVALLFSSGKEQLFHWVDAAHHHAISIAHPEWVIGWDVDAALGVSTRKKLLDRAAADRLRVFGAHMPFPGLGAVRRRDSAYEYLIEPWISA